jgi:hypothetical protein
LQNLITALKYCYFLTTIAIYYIELTTAKQYHRLSKQPINAVADPSISPEQQEKLLHDQRTEEQKFIEDNFKVGPQFSTVDDSDDPAIYKIMPETVELATTKHADRRVVKVFRSGNRGPPTIHFPEHWKNRLGIKYDDEGYGEGNNLVELEMDPDWQYIKIRKVPRLKDDNNDNDD